MRTSFGGARRISGEIERATCCVSVHRRVARVSMGVMYLWFKPVPVLSDFSLNSWRRSCITLSITRTAP